MKYIQFYDRRSYHFCWVFLLHLLFWANSSPLVSQNMILNGDFELFSIAPNDQGQITRATSWEEVVLSADYMNITYAGWTPEIGGAYAGNGFAGFASYGDMGGSSESIGQDISANPIVPGNSYKITLHAKKTSEGFYTQNCGGVELTGFNSTPALGGIGTHPENLAGFHVLWISEPVFDSVWGTYQACFESNILINYIVFSTEKVANCAQYIYIDSVEIKTQNSTGFSIGNDTSICMGTTLTLNATCPTATYLWQDNSTNPTYIVTQSGPYSVTVSTAGCIMKDTVMVSVIDCTLLLIVPNVFTPDHNGVNDLFSPTITGTYTNADLIIYNRWGEPVFHQKSTLTGWDGTTNGAECPEGVYFWIIVCEGMGGNKIEKSGNVSLFRAP